MVHTSTGMKVVDFILKDYKESKAVPEPKLNGWYRKKIFTTVSLQDDDCEYCFGSVYLETMNPDSVIGKYILEHGTINREISSIGDVFDILNVSYPVHIGIHKFHGKVEQIR